MRGPGHSHVCCDLSLMDVGSGSELRPAELTDEPGLSEDGPRCGVTGVVLVGTTPGFCFSSFHFVTLSFLHLKKF